jgi:hypothetical protein
MDRRNNLYGDIFEQLGGKSDSKNSQSAIHQKKTTAYTPSDMSLEDQRSLSKLFEVNRLLKKELDETKLELKITKEKLAKAK